MSLSSIIKGWSNHILNEFGFTEAPEYSKERLSICNGCDKRKNDICSTCGCYVPAKVLVKEEKCPNSLWQQ